MAAKRSIWLLQLDPNFKVIVLTITDSDQVIGEALDAGARGFVRIHESELSTKRVDCAPAQTRDADSPPRQPPTDRGRHSISQRSLLLPRPGPHASSAENHAG
jgi:hypothetical protein